MATVTGTRRLLDISGNNISTEVSLEASGTLLDVNGQSGTSGQILSSTGSTIDWINNSTGTVTGITQGPGITVTASATSPTVAVDYLGTDSIIKAAPTASGAVAIGDFLLVANSSGNVFETTMSNLPFVTTTGNQSIAGVKSFSGKIGADGGIDGLTLANGGISGSNYDITGVNQLVIADPGEGIVFTGTATMYLNAVDDATDSILKLTNATQLNLNSTARITNLVNPTGTQDAATKNYVDTEIGNIPSGLAFEGNWNASTDTPTLAGTTQDNGKFWIVSVAGSTNLSGITDWAVGDWAIYVDNGAGTDAWQKVDNSSSLAGAGSAGKVTFWSSTSNVSFNNNFTYDGTYLTAPRMRVGDGTDGYFWSDTAGRTAFAAGDFYIQNTVANYYNYATRIYLGDNTGDNVLFRGSTITGTSWGITPAGAATFTTVTGTTVIGGVSTSNVDGQGNIPFKLSIDYSSYMVAAAGSTWGLFWAGNSGARYGTNGNGGPGNIWGNSGNPNEFVFVGSDNTRWTVNGNTGDTWQNGDLYVGGGDIILSGTGRIQGVDTVSASTDAANKDYVDTAVGGVSSGVTSVNFKTDGTALNVASNTITGSGTMTGIWQGTSSEYVNGLGDRVAFPSIPQGDITAVVAGTGLTGGGTSGSVTLNVAANTYTPYNDIRSLGVQAFTNGANPNITTAQVMAEIEADGGFDSYSSVFKTSWSYAGNYNLTDAGDFTETAGSSWITWTDNSSDTTRGNITTLAIAPTTGGSAGGVFIYNDQGAGYSPGWRQVWTSTTDGSGSGLDADLLDGLQATSFLRSDAADTSTGEILFDAGFKSDSILLSGSQNFDNISRSGFYNLYNTNTGSTGSPGFDYGTMIVVGGNKQSTTFGLQIAHERTGSGMYVRGMNDSGSTWYAWDEIWNSGNDGAGSGLDADLLDGQQGSYYLAYANFTGTPTIPSVGNGTLTVQGTGVLGGSGTFTANQSGNSTISVTHDNSGATAGSYTNANITINASGHITAAANGSDANTNYYTTTATFNTGNGIISFSGAGGQPAYSVDIDGRFLPLAGGVMSGKIGRSSAIVGFLEGSYNNVGANGLNTNPIYTIGSSYNPASTTLGNMYGVGYASAGASFITLTGASNWGFYVAADGDARVWLDGSNGNISHAGDLYVGGGDIILSGTGRIQGVDTVSSGTDAANKTYVDNAVAGVPQGDITNVSTTSPITGGGSSGSVTIAHANSGVTATTYTAATIAVNATGHITSASSNTIPTNNNQLTNGSGYITAGSTNTLTNKSGNISQWTNDSGYITSSSLPTVNNATITIAAGTNLTTGGNFTTNQGSNETITINMATGGVGAGTYGSTSNSTKIDNITVDAYGRITAVTTGATGNGDITGVTAGAGLSGGGTSGTPTVSVDYLGTDSIIKAAPTASGSISTADFVLVANSSGNVFETPLSTLPFSNNSGDITGVTAGNKLTGGGTSGTVTLGLASNNISQWTNDSGYTTNVGDITGVTAGDGLSGGGTSGSVSLAVDYGTAGLIADSPGGSGAPDVDDLVLIGLDSSSGGETRAFTLADLPFIRTSGSQSISGTKTFTTQVISADIEMTSVQSRTKLSVWSGSTYGFGMQSGYTFGGLANEYAITSQMSNTSGRGFWWGDSAHTNAQGAMALTTKGLLTVAGGMRLAYGEADTTSPAATYKLDVGGHTLINGTEVVRTSTGVGDFYLGNFATANHFRFHTNNSQTYFDMNCGQINWRQGSSTRYYFYPSTANMTINGTLTQNSDSRVKENVVEIDNCISKVQAMRGVYYNRTDFNTEVTKVGVIAQEVEAVLPELILEASDTGLKSVAYAELTAVLINAIKEQQETIEDLKTRITELEN